MPKIAQIAGPCLDAKQCQSCARDIVLFYIKLDQQIQQEKEMRDKQRQKSLMEKEANSQKQKQEEKKNKKKQKQQAVVANNEKSKSNGTVPKKTDKVKAKETKKLVQSKNLFLKFFVYLFTIFTFTGLALFIATSLNVSYTKHFEEQVASIWKSGVYNLPAEYQPIIQEAERNFKYVHNFTGYEITRLFNQLFKND